MAATLSTGDLVITDPTHTPKERLNGFDRWALARIKDERDLPFLYLWLKIGFIVVPFAIAMFAVQSPPWWMCVAYFVVALAIFMPPYILMLHNTSHRRLFKKEHAWMNNIIPWVMGPFFGESPETYFSHHIGMHHPENNLHDDLSTTMPFQRDSFGGFMRYVGRFLALGLLDLIGYHKRKGRDSLRTRTIVGELSFYAVCIALLFVNVVATLFVFIIPLYFARFMMMAGNWAQHAFVDAADPANPYRNSLVCINSVYNRRCFNDGYHVGHHVKANRHWTEMPADFVNRRQEYIDNDTLIFEKIDYFAIWALLMAKRHRFLAKFFVDLRPEGEKLTIDEIVALMKRRLAPIPANVDTADATATQEAA